MKNILIAISLSVSAHSAEIIDLTVKSPEGISLRLKFDSHDKVLSYLGKADGENPLALEVLRNEKVVLSIPVTSVPVEVRKANTSMGNAGKLTIKWSEDGQYLTLIEQYDLGRPPDFPQESKYWLGSPDGPRKIE